ncbi:MAG: WD40 repeat domain-containing protein, partial [Chloroflexota bacterium]
EMYAALFDNNIFYILKNISSRCGSKIIVELTKKYYPIVFICLLYMYVPNSISIQPLSNNEQSAASPTPIPTETRINRSNSTLVNIPEAPLIRDISYSPDGQHIAVASSVDLRLYDVKSGELGEPLTKNAMRSARWSPDGDRLASVSRDNVIDVWDISTEEIVFSLHGHSGVVHRIHWSPDGSELVSCGNDGTLIVWDMSTGELLTNIDDQKYSIRDVSWSPDGQHIAYGSAEGLVYVWNRETRKQIRVLEKHTKSVYSVSWSPNGKKIASGSADGSVVIWDWESGEPLLSFKQHTDWVYSIAWSPDGLRLASGSADKSVRVWDGRTGTEHHLLDEERLKGYGLTMTSSIVYSVSWSPDGDKVASGTFSGNLYIWNLPRSIPHRGGKIEFSH